MTTVTDFRKMTFHQAKKEMQNNNLPFDKIVYPSPDPFDNTLAGTVRDQSPTAGLDEPTLDVVDTIVTIEVYKAIIPNVEGDGLETAKTKIWNVGLTADINYLDPLEEGKNYSVVKQYITAGDVLPAGTVLRIDAKVKELVGIGRIKEPRLIERESPFPFPPRDPLKNPGEEIRINPGLKSQLDIDKVKMTGKNKIIR